jgi:hypothetical protein
MFTMKSDYGLSKADYDKIIDWARSILPEENIGWKRTFILLNL